MNAESSKPNRTTPRLQAVLLVAFDVLATFAAYYAAAWGSADWEASFSPLGPVPSVAAAALVSVAVFTVFNMYDSLWRYASISEVLRILAATVIAALLSDLALEAVLGSRLSLRDYVLAWAMLLLLVAGARLAIRALAGSQSWRFLGGPVRLQPKTLVVGAGETGALAVNRMLAGDRDMPGSPVAAVDDDPAKLGMRVHGVKVAGTTDDIPRVAADCEAEQIVIACPSATRSQRRRICDVCMSTGLRVLTLPNVRDVPTEEVGRIALRDVDAGDLLSRDEILLDVDLVSGYVTGKTILVTGGGGSIGSELVRQLLPARPAKVVLFDVYENTTYELYHEIRGGAEEAGIRLAVEIGSITNEDAIGGCFAKHRPDVVFHAAAHKHVPLMEGNPREAIENNVFGTLNVARLADAHECSHFVFVSTDKAVNPTSVMGATKRMGEMIVQLYSQTSETVFAAVRFGNVLGSHGSVIPLFRRQMREGGPVTVTHRDITRYFMTIPEASRLVITAGALARGGETFILKMGEPVRIYDLAVNLIRLSGLEPGRDIEIEVTGLREGEKLYEELLMDTERTVPTHVDDIVVSTGRLVTAEEARGKLALLEASLGLPDDDVKRALARAVPTYTPDIR